MTSEAVVTQVVVIGGGQAGLAAGYYLRRAKLDFVILDARTEPGGAWPHGWNSLRLFSPARHSSLPGWPMPAFREGYPPAQHVVEYLTAYEKRYELPIHRPVRVRSVRRDPDGLRVETDLGDWTAGAVISATGTWWRPFIPTIPGTFTGRQLHTVEYRGPEQFAGQRVVVVGGGNSGAQIAADLAEHVDLTWCTARPPRYLPDEIDGKALFDIATTKPGGIGHLGDIVAVPPVRLARDAGLLTARPVFDRFDGQDVVWSDGTREPADTVIWCTGFRPALGHLSPLGLRAPDGLIPTTGTRAVGEPRLHLLGYGNWTGAASATLIGVGRTAKAAVTEIAADLS
ncbi:ArsO family NAD(P)H-dependent flavin-containing monooxygenase [Umezawaea sp. NPDC059074]|uniref:ArsO family NAD(P)H-dependent flavin-containing monooxygenase n=1 Tax=Umezawaea sp. NPDC059074 TaxID=3346716 RepID=UPI0036B2A498